jgi:DNA-directed RNA polymerase specialized sigma24 family protein
MEQISRSKLKRDWAPTEAAFRRFLDWLNEGHDSKGERYLEMRQRLVRYFDHKQCVAADDLADETLNRVMRRLEEEGTITDATPAHYCYIVAKFVFLEHLRLVRPEGNSDDSDFDSAAIAVSSSPPPDQTAQKMLDCLDLCLQNLAAGERDLILEYYRGEQGEKIQRRRELAEKLELSTNALSIRACRIRDRLEQCVGRCSAAS